MAKLTLSDLASLTNQSSAVAAINANSALIEAVLEKTLSRDGTSPNSMSAVLDMNSHRVINLPAPGGALDPMREQDVEAILTEFRDSFIPSTDQGLLDTGVQIDTDAYANITESTPSGWFHEYTSKGFARLIVRGTYSSTNTTTDFINDGLFVNYVDGDGTVHDADAGNRGITNGIRVVTTGNVVGGNFIEQYKDIVGGDFTAIGRISDVARGVSGILASSIQKGIGICSHEFAVENSEDADEQSISMAGVQCILQNHFAESDNTHLARGLYVSVVNSYLSSSGIEMLSAPHQSDSDRDSAVIRGLNMASLSVSSAAIRMAASRAGSSGDPGTIIEYDSNDYTRFDRTLNDYHFVAAGADVMQVGPSGFKFRSAATIPNLNVRYDCGIQMTNDTTMVIFGRGSDGMTRGYSFTLS